MRSRQDVDELSCFRSPSGAGQMGEPAHYVDRVSNRGLKSTPSRVYPRGTLASHIVQHSPPVMAPNASYETLCPDVTSMPEPPEEWGQSQERSLLRVSERVYRIGTTTVATQGVIQRQNL